MRILFLATVLLAAVSGLDIVDPANSDRYIVGGNDAQAEQ
jgi:hypothetical protein